MVELIVYDIEIDRVRTKIAKLLIRSGYHRIQESVFVGRFRKRIRDRVWDMLIKILSETEPETNMIYGFLLEDAQFDDYKAIGKKPYLDVILGRVHTMVV